MEQLLSVECVDQSHYLTAEVLEVARQHQLSSYDAEYLRLATDRGLPLLMFDNNLRQAAERVGVALL